jgi:aminopeptidase N
MRDGIARGRTTSAKSIFFNGYRSMALTPGGVRYLERVWSRAEKVAGLPFAEPDEATMALELAVRGVPNTEAILQTQRNRMTNPDRKARFEFVMPALASAPDVRQRFFESLRDVSHRRREPWVTEAVSYLHHPLRAAESIPLVAPSLELLQEIQRTGDIFFPKNWMDATLSGHQSPRVAETVRQFLAQRPDYPVRLRRIVLQSADDLFRAVELLH